MWNKVTIAKSIVALSSIETTMKEVYKVTIAKSIVALSSIETTMKEVSV